MGLSKYVKYFMYCIVELGSIQGKERIDRERVPLLNKAPTVEQAIVMVKGTQAALKTLIADTAGKIIGEVIGSAAFAAALTAAGAYWDDILNAVRGAGTQSVDDPDFYLLAKNFFNSTDPEIQRQWVQKGLDEVEDMLKKMRKSSFKPASGSNRSEMINKAEQLREQLKNMKFKLSQNNQQVLTPQNFSVDDFPLEGVKVLRGQFNGAGKLPTPLFDDSAFYQRADDFLRDADVSVQKQLVDEGLKKVDAMLQKMKESSFGVHNPKAGSEMIDRAQKIQSDLAELQNALQGKEAAPLLSGQINFQDLPFNKLKVLGAEMDRLTGQAVGSLRGGASASLSMSGLAKPLIGASMGGAVVGAGVALGVELSAVEKAQKALIERFGFVIDPQDVSMKPSFAWICNQAPYNIKITLAPATDPIHKVYNSHARIIKRGQYYQMIGLPATHLSGIVITAVDDEGNPIDTVSKVIAQRPGVGLGVPAGGVLFARVELQKNNTGEARLWLTQTIGRIQPVAS